MNDSGSHESGGHEHKTEYKIIVNTREKIVFSDDLTFDQAVHLAYENPPVGENIMFEITFRKAAEERPDGILTEGQTVEIKNGTIFNVHTSDKS
jgi:hypothetical protein